MKKFIPFVSFVLLILACALIATPFPTDSGITGKVLIGPMCPVLIEGQDCPDQPYQATITLKDIKGREILRIQTDEQGNFILPLSPGEYILIPEPPEGKPFPFADEQSFVVLPGEYTHLIVLYDSGIR